MKKDKGTTITIQDLVDKINSFNKEDQKEIVMHLPDRVILDPEFYERLKQEFESKMTLCSMGIDKLSSLDQLLILILRDSF